MEIATDMQLQLPGNLQTIPVPVKTGPSNFPHNIDQLKTIEYSSVPADGIIDAKLKRYYELLGLVASNMASEENLNELQHLSIEIRQYIVTEDDYNLLADAVRTTQIYLKNASEANVNNYVAITQVLQIFLDQLNTWSKQLNTLTNNLNVTPSVLVDGYYMGKYEPVPPKNYSGRVIYWVDTSNEEEYVLKQGVIKNGEVTSWGTVNDETRDEKLQFTRLIDIMKRKVVLTSLNDGATTYTTDNDIVLQEIPLQGPGVVNPDLDGVMYVDDLIDGRFGDFLDNGLDGVSPDSIYYGG